MRLLPYRWATPHGEWWVRSDSNRQCACATGLRPAVHSYRTSHPWCDRRDLNAHSLRTAFSTLRVYRFPHDRMVGDERFERSRQVTAGSEPAGSAKFPQSPMIWSPRPDSNWLRSGYGPDARPNEPHGHGHDGAIRTRGAQLCRLLPYRTWLRRDGARPGIRTQRPRLKGANYSRRQLAVRNSMGGETRTHDLVLPTHAGCPASLRPYDENWWIARELNSTQRHCKCCSPALVHGNPKWNPRADSNRRWTAS